MKVKLKPAYGRKVALIGGTGFVGTQITQQLANAGYRVHVIARDAAAGAHLTCFGATGQVIVSSGDVRKPESLSTALTDAYAVVYLPGLLFESGSQKFETVHASAPETVALMCKESGVERFVFMSALGVNHAKKSVYACTKHEGEARVTAARSDTTIMRPSVIFGADDNFLNQFARMALFSPVLPLIGGGKTRFQPVYVSDVAQAVVHILGNDKTAGKTYELGGADILTFKDILKLICHTIQRDPTLISIPSCVASLMGSIMAATCPKPQLTADQVRLLSYDNTTSEHSSGLASLGIIPHSIYTQAPIILQRYVQHKPQLAA